MHLRMPVDVPLNTRRTDIEGLRGIAVLAIIAFDCKMPGVPGGFTGVDVFLVLSGYFTTRLIEEHIDAGTFTYKRFYLERLRRIMPGLIAIIFFCLMLGLLVLSPWEAYRLGQTTVASAVFASNFIYLIRGSFFAERAITYPLLMTWPIDLAIQFYVLLPFLAGSLRMRSRRASFWSMTAFSGLSLLASIYAEFHQHIWNFYLPVTRAWEMGAGSMLALWGTNQMLDDEPKATFVKNQSEFFWRQHVAGAAGLLAVVVSFVAFRSEMRFPGYEALLPVLGSILILASPKSLPNRLLATQQLVVIGSISFYLYLWHWPLLSFAAICGGQPLHVSTIILVLVLTTIFALAFKFLLERPLHSAHKLGSGRDVFRFVVALCFLVCLGLLLFVTKGLPARSPILYRIESHAGLYRHYPCISSGAYLRLSSQCAPAPQPQMSAMAVLGGGHAEAFAEGLRDYLHENSWQLITLTRESCAPLLGVSQWSDKDSTLRKSCGDFNRAALAYVLSRPDVRAVVLVGRWRGPLVQDTYRGEPATQTALQNVSNLRLGLQQEAKRLELAGKRVVVVEDTPEFPIDPVAAVRDRYLPLRRFVNRMSFADSPTLDDGSSVVRSIAISADEELADAQVKMVKQVQPAISLVDPKQVFCDTSRCRFISGGNLFFSDNIHLSRSGALQLVPLLPGLSTLR